MTAMIDIRSAVQPAYEQAVIEVQRRHMALSADPRTSVAAFERFERQVHGLMNRWPESPHLLFSLGTLYMQTDRAGTAISLLHRAVDRGVQGPQPWLNLAGAWKVDHDDEQAEQCYLKALALCGDYPDSDERGIDVSRAAALHGLASLYINRGMPERCIHWAEKCLAVDPTDRFALWNKGLALLELGRWQEGFRLYDVAGFMEGANRPRDRKLKEYGGRLKRWDGETGVTVVCYGEQGIGDEIMFFSMLPDLMRDCRVIIECDPRLESMIRRSFPQAVAVYPTSGQDMPFDWLDRHPDCTHYVPCGSLGRYYRHRDADFPRQAYLTPDPARVERWWRELPARKGPRVALSWAGGLKKTRFDKRSVPLDQLESLLGVPNVEFFSLQYHPWAADECARVGTELGVPIHHWGDVIADYEETAAFLQHMDLVVSVNTSLVHLAGALGVPTLCLTPKYVAWRYGVAGPNPWYGSVEMLRQTKDDDWKGPITVATDRVVRLAGRREAA
jgi:tetratricopeptide (TPR) repeat protein